MQLRNSGSKKYLNNNEYWHSSILSRSFPVFLCSKYIKRLVTLRSNGTCKCGVLALVDGNFEFIHVLHTQILFGKSNISYYTHLIHTWFAYQEVRNVSFSGNFAYVVNRWTLCNQWWKWVLIRLQSDLPQKNWSWKLKFLEVFPYSTMYPEMDRFHT